MKLVTLEVQLKEDEELPIANLEDGEHIEVRITPLKELYAHLEGQLLDCTTRLSLISVVGQPTTRWDTSSTHAYIILQLESPPRRGISFDWNSSHRFPRLDPS